MTGICSDQYMCCLCKKCFTTVGNRNKHLKNIHFVEVESSWSLEKRIPCCEWDCITLVHSIADLRKHLQLTHGFLFREHTLQFFNEREFYTWKEDLESAEKVLFVKKRGDKRSGKTVQRYFQCNRSGYYLSQSTGKRKPRESCKIGQMCTATMTVTIDNITNEVTVKFYGEHYGHECDVKYIRQSKVCCSENDGIALTGHLTDHSYHREEHTESSDRTS